MSICKPRNSAKFYRLAVTVIFRQPPIAETLFVVQAKLNRSRSTMSLQQQIVSPNKPAASIDVTNGIQQVDLHAMREPYGGKEAVLRESDLPTKEPFGLFRQWFEQAKADSKQLEPNAVCVATASKDGRPAARMMLLKEFGPEGFKFFTSYSGRKASDLDENPRACMLFYWDARNQQVRIEGTVKKCSDQENKQYFSERPKESQLSAVISRQSKPVGSREELEKEWHDMQDKAKNSSDTVECPDYWGGYCLQPELFEFWKGHTNRLHDRILFRHAKPDEKLDEHITHQGENGWVYERLYP